MHLYVYCVRKLQYNLINSIKNCKSSILEKSKIKIHIGFSHTVSLALDRDHRNIYQRQTEQLIEIFDKSRVSAEIGTL